MGKEPVEASEGVRRGIKADSWERLVDSGGWDRPVVACRASDSRPTLARIPKLLPRTWLSYERYCSHRKKVRMEGCVW